MAKVCGSEPVKSEDGKHSACRIHFIVLLVGICGGCGDKDVGVAVKSGWSWNVEMS